MTEQLNEISSTVEQSTMSTDQSDIQTEPKNLNLLSITQSNENTKHAAGNENAPIGGTELGQLGFPKTEIMASGADSRSAGRIDNVAAGPADKAPDRAQRIKDAAAEMKAGGNIKALDLLEESAKKGKEEFKKMFDDLNKEAERIGSKYSLKCDFGVNEKGQQAVEVWLSHPRQVGWGQEITFPSKKK